MLSWPPTFDIWVPRNKERQIMCRRIQDHFTPTARLCPRQWLLDVGGWDEQLPGCHGFDDSDLYTRLNISRGFGLYLTIDRMLSEAQVLHQ